MQPGGVSGCAVHLLRAWLCWRAAQSRSAESRDTAQEFKAEMGMRDLINGAALERGVLQFLRTANGQDLS